MGSFESDALAAQSRLAEAAAGGMDIEVWTTLTTAISAPDGTLSFTDPTPPADKAFYRIQPAP